MLLPPSHIHLASRDHDHHDHDAGVEHSHWSSHGGASRLAIDDDDGRAIFVDHPALVRALHADLPRRTGVVVAVLIPIDSQSFTVTARRLAGNAPRDGPARNRPTFRGPPLVL